MSVLHKYRGRIQEPTTAIWKPINHLVWFSLSLTREKLFKGCFTMKCASACVFPHILTAHSYLRAARHTRIWKEVAQAVLMDHTAPNRMVLWYYMFCPRCIWGTGYQGQIIGIFMHLTRAAHPCVVWETAQN